MEPGSEATNVALWVAPRNALVIAYMKYSDWVFQSINLLSADEIGEGD